MNTNNNKIYLCRKCKVELNDSNWWLSRKKHKSYICNKCETERINKYRLNNKEKLYQKGKAYSIRSRLWSKKRIPHCGLNKRPKSKLCELCCNKEPKGYHHWDDNNLNMGIWLCQDCHWGAEFIDKKSINKAIEYLKLKKEIEIIEESRQILDGLQKAAIHINKKRTRKKKEEVYVLSYRHKYYRIIEFTSTIEPNVALRENIMYNINTKTINISSSFFGTNKNRLKTILER